MFFIRFIGFCTDKTAFYTFKKTCVAGWTEPLRLTAFMEWDFEDFSVYGHILLMSLVYPLFLNTTIRLLDINLF